jgi:hypothetical protein
LSIVGAAKENETLTARGFYEDVDPSNTTYRWYSKNNVVGNTKTLTLTSVMVGDVVTCEATHTWLGAPLSSTAKSAVVEALPTPQPIVEAAGTRAISLPQSNQPSPTVVPVSQPVASTPPTSTPATPATTTTTTKTGPANLTGVTLKGGATHASPIIATCVWDSNGPAGQVVVQWSRMTGKGTFVPVQNARTLAYSPTVDDLHSTVVRVRVQQINENGETIGNGFERDVPAEFLTMDKSVSSRVDSAFQANGAFFSLRNENGAPRSIFVNGALVQVIDGTKQNGPVLSQTQHDNALEATLSPHDAVSFSLSMTGSINRTFVCANALDRDGIVLTIRSFKGRALTQSKAQLERVNSMAQKLKK